MTVSRFTPGGEWESPHNPELYLNGGYFDHEDDNSHRDLHVFNPFLQDPRARLDASSGEATVLDDGSRVESDSVIDYEVSAE